MIEVKGCVLNKAYKEIGDRNITFMSGKDIKPGNVGFTVVNGKCWQVRVISEEEYGLRNVGG